MATTIMTVDDSRSIREMVRFSLNGTNYDVLEAEDGETALKKLGSSDVSMILADVNMPRMGGLELLRRVRENPKLKYLPVIMLTTDSEEAQKNKGRAAGATGWIVKPFNPDQLRGVIRRVVGH